ncbi:hypothetical protein [Actinomadura nitritigenes]|uniref:hypothetical protein n=1 Tax=Actinomadura nitritigenes TaxID=134602 RepID=UPI003D8D5C96
MRPSVTVAVTSALASVGALAFACPASAADPVWTVVNPGTTSDITATGPFSMRSADGFIDVTCQSLITQGSIPSRSSTSAQLGSIFGTGGINCIDTTGQKWNFRIPDSGWMYMSGYDASTGRTSLRISTLLSLAYNSAGSCMLVFRTLAGSYTNDGSTLKILSSPAEVPTKEDGTSACPGFTDGSTITFTDDLKVTPAVTITAS